MTAKGHLGNIFKASVQKIAAFDVGEAPKPGHLAPKLDCIDESIKAVPRHNLWPI
jgi:hypothetical protein